MAESSERRVRGATIEEALNQARADFGTSDVRVLHATRLRRGGVGGFFAKDLGVELIVAPAHDAETLERQLAAGREISAGTDLYRQLGREAADAAIAERAALLLAEDDRAYEASAQALVAEPPVSQPVVRVPQTVVPPVTEIETDRPVWATALAPLIDEPAPRTSVAAALSKLSSAAGLASPQSSTEQPPLEQPSSGTLEISPSTASLAAMLDESQDAEASADESTAIAALVESIARRSAAPLPVEPSDSSVTADDVMPGDVMPDDVVSDDVVSGDVVSGDVVSGDVVSGDVVSGDVVSGDVVSGDVVSGDVVSGDVVSDDVVSGDVVSGDVVSGDVVSGDVMPDDAPVFEEIVCQDAHSTAGERTLAFEPAAPAEEKGSSPAPAPAPDAEPASISVLEAPTPPAALDVLPSEPTPELEETTLELAGPLGGDQPITPATVSVTAQPAPSQEGFVADWGSWAVSRTLRAIAEERRRALADEPAAVPAMDPAITGSDHVQAVNDIRAVNDIQAVNDIRAVNDVQVLDDSDPDGSQRDGSASSGTVPRMEDTGASSAPSREAVALWHASRALKHRQTKIVEAPDVTTPSTQYFANLRAAGLPDELLELVCEGASVREALTSIDAAVAYPGSLDGIVVVAGPAQLVTTWAQALAKASGLDPREVMTVSPVTTRENNRLSGAEEAFAWRCSRHGGTRLVALEVPTLSNMTGYVRSVIKALRPTQVRLLTRADDLDAAKRWLELTPTAVLDVVGISRSRRPAGFLALGAPVATIDGEAMDAGDLAATLLERCCR